MFLSFFTKKYSLYLINHELFKDCCTQFDSCAKLLWSYCEKFKNIFKITFTVEPLFGKKPATLLKKDSTVDFPKNFLGSFRTAFLQNTCEQLLSFPIEFNSMFFFTSKGVFCVKHVVHRLKILLIHSIQWRSYSLGTKTHDAMLLVQKWFARNWTYLWHTLFCFLPMLFLKHCKHTTPARAPFFQLFPIYNL